MSKKILVIVARDSSNPLAAGGDTHITLLAKELAQTGNTVVLWCSRHETQEKSAVDAGVRVERIAPLRLLPPVVWARELTGRTNGYDLVIEDLIGGARLPFLSALLSRQPHIGFWFQDNDPLLAATYSTPFLVVARAMQRFLLRVYRHGFVIVPSTQTRDWLLGCGYDTGRIAVYPRLQPITFPLETIPPFGQRMNEFVCIGNLRPLKRLEESIDVLSQLRQVVPDARLTIIGREDDRDYLRRLQRLASNPALAGSVEILVNAPDPVKFSRLARAKALTLHSPIEGLGWTIVEAGVCGTPAVGNTGVPKDVLVDRVNGIRVASRDVMAYCSALRGLMTDADEWSRLSHGAQKVAERFVRPVTNVAVHQLIERCAATT